MASVFCDWGANTGNPKIQAFLLSFRVAQRIRSLRQPVRLFFLPYLVFHRILFEWFLGIELPWGTRVGAGLRIFHGVGLVVNDRTVIGANVVLRNGTTIGVKSTSEFGVGDAPRISDGVDVGANSVIIGNIRVGIGAVIGAGTVVVKDVPDFAVVVGNPSRVISVRRISS